MLSRSNENVMLDNKKKKQKKNRTPFSLLDGRTGGVDRRGRRRRGRSGRAQSSRSLSSRAFGGRRRGDHFLNHRIRVCFLLSLHVGLIDDGLFEGISDAAGGLEFSKRPLDGTTAPCSWPRPLHPPPPPFSSSCFSFTFRPRVFLFFGFFFGLFFGFFSAQRRPRGLRRQSVRQSAVACTCSCLALAFCVCFSLPFFCCLVDSIHRQQQQQQQRKHRNRNEKF